MYEEKMVMIATVANPKNQSQPAEKAAARGSIQRFRSKQPIIIRMIIEL